MSYLTAVDTSLEHELSPVDHTNNLVAVSNDEVDRVIRLWRDTAGRRGEVVNPYQELYKYVHPLVIGALDRASSLSLMLCREILSYHLKDKRKAERISQRLNSAYPAHQYPITSREARQLGLRVDDLDPGLDRLLQELNLIYSEMGQRAITDFDEGNHHDNEITNILEGRGLQVFYQVEKDWHYRNEERRWVPMNDLSAWYRAQRKNGKRGEVEVPHPLDLGAVTRRPRKWQLFRAERSASDAFRLSAFVRSASERGQSRGRASGYDPSIRRLAARPPQARRAPPQWRPADHPARRGRTRYSQGRPRSGRDSIFARSTPRRAKAPIARCRIPGSLAQGEDERGLRGGVEGPRLAGEDEEARVVLRVVLDALQEDLPAVEPRRQGRADGRRSWPARRA